jgi:hypothetical protein
MTRAREHLHVLTCVHPDDLDPTRLGNGAADLYGLLAAYLKDSGPVSHERPRDPLVADLADRLQQRHGTVVPHFAGSVDLAVWNPLGMPSRDGQASAERTAPVALISDGSELYRRMSVRERSRQRPHQLERSGWRYYPLWTIDVFADPAGCAEAVASFLGLPAAGDGPGDILAEEGMDLRGAARAIPVTAPVEASVDDQAGPSGAGAHASTEPGPRDADADAAVHSMPAADGADEDSASQGPSGAGSTAFDQATRDVDSR